MKICCRTYVGYSKKDMLMSHGGGGEVYGGIGGVDDDELCWIY